ncbi:unnamed protein product [Dibothriocephalus latus]|uniref:Reverse transcriptase domain-containing protein n=1 Tax=Dibothriocephalus latus TaxID=60516 RepID=A0A3P6QC77_DIBLA|nr:unnamed protein product [Dibothriocephalus latus]
MEQASNVGDTRNMYQIISQVSDKPGHCDSVRNVNSGFISDSSVKVDRWREHTKHFLNFDAKTITFSLSSTAEFQRSPACAVSCELFEVADSMQGLRNNKACGEDYISAEINKSCVEILAHRLHEMIGQAWRDEAVPDDWASGTLVPVYKKGDKTTCGNYRGISLIDVAAKIFAIVLRSRFQPVRDSRARPNQAGFRTGHGCADQIFTLSRIREFRYSYQQPTAVCFVDYRDSMRRIIELGGVPN